MATAMPKKAKSSSRAKRNFCVKLDHECDVSAEDNFIIPFSGGSLSRLLASEQNTTPFEEFCVDYGTSDFAASMALGYVQ